MRQYGTLLIDAAATAVAAEYRRIYEEALATGYINTRNSVVVLNGAGGSGKTHVKEAISNRPPPSVRESTALSEDPITFSILHVHAFHGLWKVMDKEQQASMLASAMAAMATLKGKWTTPPSDSECPSPTTDTNLLATSSSGAIPLPPPTTTPTLKPMEPVLPSSPSPPLQTRYKEAHHEEPHPVESDFLDRIGRAQATVEEPYNYDLVYLFDTGGQPAFHAILPLFFPLVMFILFVLKLSEKLDHHPMVHFFVRGKPVGAPYMSPLSHLEIAQHSFCAIQSQMLVEQRSNKGLPKMMIVGTHRDKEQHCSESIQEKNRKLAEILSPSFKEHLIYRSAEENSLIFPLDAKHRKQKDCKIAAEIRQAITIATSAIESKKTPLSWHVLELALRELAGKLGRGILTRAECITEATKLDISERVLDAALDHFVHLNTILYYRTVLPDVVFIQAQPLMQKMTELIQQTHALRGQIPDKRTPIQGKWLKFRDEGIITLDILESFPDSYLEGVFIAADLIRLMEHKLLVSSIDQSSYFMPVLLPDLSPEEVAQHRVGPDSAIAPLTILFPCDLVPVGLFCSLVSSLLSAATPPQLRLKISPSDRALMECVASNCIKFSLPDNAGSLVLINTLSHLELHLVAPLMEDPTPLCLDLKAKVLASITTATHTMHFDKLVPQCGFLCEASTPHAKVKVTPERHWLGRRVFGDPRQVEVAPPTHPARLCGGHGWACFLDCARIYGKLEKRHTIWLQDQLSSKYPSLLTHSSFFDGLNLFYPHLLKFFQSLNPPLFIDPFPPGTNSKAAPDPFDHAPSLLNLPSSLPSSMGGDGPVLTDPQPKPGPFPAPHSPLLLEADGDREPVPHLRPGLSFCGHIYMHCRYFTSSLAAVILCHGEDSICPVLTSFFLPSLDTTPTLPLLISFPTETTSLNIPKQLGTGYTMLGSLLLQDDCGDRVASLRAQYMLDTDDINIAILREWLKGGGLQPVTWTTLTTAMKKAGQVALAERIWDGLKH